MSNRIMSKHIRFSPDEWEKVCKKAQEAEMKPCTLVRWMVLHGEVKVYDTELVNNLLVQVNSVGININQIAKVVNSTGEVFRKDIEDIQKQMDDLTAVVENYLKKYDVENIL